MAWTDPKNKRFLTTGWAMFLVGLLLVGVRLSNSTAFAGFDVGLAYGGLFLMVGALIVWIMKAIECMQAMSSASHVKKSSGKVAAAKPTLAKAAKTTKSEAKITKTPAKKTKRTKN